MFQRKVDVGRDHVKSLIGNNPLKTIIELIWNGLDAGGPAVSVTLRRNSLGSIETLEVADEGPGIPVDMLGEAFGTIGGSAKASERTNPDGRVYHGRDGKGRFRALAICPVVRWETKFLDAAGELMAYTISLRRDAPDVYSVTEPEPAAGKATGTTFVAEGVDQGQNKLLGDSIPQQLAQEFASYLMSYPSVHLLWDGRKIDINSLIARTDNLSIAGPSDGDPGTPLRVVEWNFRPDTKKLYICDEAWFAFHELSAGLRAPGIEFTAYVATSRARTWRAESKFEISDIDPEISDLVESAKAELRQHLRSRLAEESQHVVEEWKEQQVYPYPADPPTNPIARTEREVFDIVAVQLNEQHPTFSRSDKEHKRLTLALVRQSLESNPADLTRLLKEVAALPSEAQAALVELLDRTSLSNIVRAGRLVTDRLDTLLAFEKILFERDWKKSLLERTQLHRLLVREIWILGEEYILGTDDDSLEELLSKHIKILDRKDLAQESDVRQINGAQGIPDLMLYRRRKVDRDRFEHLVVELKRPDAVLGSKEVTQIERYAFAVAEDERFDTKKCSWKFVLLGNSYDDYVKRRASSDALPEGCIHDGDGIRIWIQKWAEVINDARARYEFFRAELEVQASQDKGLERLKRKYPHLMTGRGASKKVDMSTPVRD